MTWESFPTGDMTAANARGRDTDFRDAICLITGLTPTAVTRRLNAADGRMLLRNVFAGDWPEADDLGDMTVKAVDEADLVDAVAMATDLSIEEARTAISGANRKMLVRNLFRDSWPTNPGYGSEIQAEGEEEEDSPELSLEELGQLKVSEAREGWAEAIAEATGLSLRRVESRLANAHGRALVMNEFVDCWPEEDVDADPPADGAEETEWERSVAEQIKAHQKKCLESRCKKLLAGKFELVQKLGSGGFGEAWAARKTLFGDRLYVVKTAHAGTASSTDSFKREYRNQFDLQHPNICRCIDIDEDPESGLLYLLMEYAGLSLADIIEKHPGLPTSFALKVVDAAASGLEHAHAENVIHLDVSPGNIMVDGALHVRVADFGISEVGKMMTIASGKRTIVANERIGYNPSYAAPESRSGSSELRRAADQYSLARVVLAMLEGRDLDPHYQVRDFARLSKAQNQALRRALDLTPSKRFPTITDFAKALRS